MLLVGILKIHYGLVVYITSILLLIHRYGAQLFAHSVLGG